MIPYPVEPLASITGIRQTLIATAVGSNIPGHSSRCVRKLVCLRLNLSRGGLRHPKTLRALVSHLFTQEFNGVLPLGESRIQTSATFLNILHPKSKFGRAYNIPEPSHGVVIWHQWPPIFSDMYGTLSTVTILKVLQGCSGADFHRYNHWFLSQTSSNVDIVGHHHNGLLRLSTNLYQLM